MINNVKPFAEIKGTVKEDNLTKTYTTGGQNAGTALGMIDGWKSPMFTGR